MREGAGESASNLVAELGQRPEAIIGLATLYAGGGAATMRDLRRAGAKPHAPAAANGLRWLATVGLVRRDTPTGSWDTTDEPGTVYRLTDPGLSLAASLTALANGLAKHERPFRTR